jgi:hypothetical protein
VQTAYDSEVQLRHEHLHVAPLLVVETLSRSTALMDRNTKKAHYVRMGVPSYWLFDPPSPARALRWRSSRPRDRGAGPVARRPAALNRHRTGGGWATMVW